MTSLTRLLSPLVLLLALSSVAAVPSADAAPAREGTSASRGLDVAPSARARTKCVKGSGTYAGTCYKFLRSTKKVVPVEAVPLRNRSSRTGTFTCSFTRTVSRAVEYGASATSSAEAEAVFGLAKISLSVTVSKKVTQTDTQASTAGGSVTLKPGQSVTCLRTYGSVIMRVQRYTYRGSEVTYDDPSKVRLPAYLGVDIVD